MSIREGSDWGNCLEFLFVLKEFYDLAIVDQLEKVADRCDEPLH